MSEGNFWTDLKIKVREWRIEGTQDQDLNEENEDG